MELFKWQEEALASWKAHQYHGICAVVTGAGKTFFALSAAKECLAADGSPLKTYIVVPTLALQRQWRDTIRWLFPSARISLAGGGNIPSSDADFFIYVVNTARYHISSAVAKHVREGMRVLLIADECHRYTGDENRKIFDYRLAKDVRRAPIMTLGLSATPFGAKFDAVLVPALGPVIYSYDFAAARNDGIISPFAIFQIAVNFTGDELKQYAALTDRLNRTHSRLLKQIPELKGLSGPVFFARVKALSDEMGAHSTPYHFLNLSYLRVGLVRNAENRVRATESLILSFPENEQVLLFCETIDQADLLYGRFAKLFPGKVRRYHSKLSKQVRADALLGFREGVCRILCACKALDEGLDVPDASVGIVVSSTQTSRQRIQRLGRILRRSEEHPLARLYYLYVDHTSEDTAYLPDAALQCPICRVSFSSADLSFIHDEYDLKASSLLSYIRERFAPDAAVMHELKACLIEGQLRGDFLLDEETLQKRLTESRGVHERNYYQAMLYLRMM